MSEPQMVSPLLDGMTLDCVLSSHGGVTVSRVIHTATGTRCIVKQISIPESETNTQALLLTGAVSDREEATAYYATVVDQYRTELRAFRALAASPYFLSYARFQVVPKEGQPGFDLYLLAPCRTSLGAFLSENAIRQKKAVQLGLDLCHALSALREQGYLYLDLKPGNVFLENGTFCIGDFGLAQRKDLRFAAMPGRYLSSFTAPELCSVTGELNETVDLYAVGLLLYYIYNGNHAPFEEAGTTEKAANNRRISGEELPTPLYADYEMDAILRKACAFRPEDRYQTPEELAAALEDYQGRNALTDECIVPPLVLDEIPTVADLPEAEEEPVEAIPATDVTNLSDDFRENFAPAQEPERPRKKKKKKIWIPILLTVLVLLGAAFAYYYFEYSAITVNTITVTEKTSDSLTVAVDATDAGALLVSCTPDEGVGATLPCGDTVTFTDLTPGTLYHIAVRAADWHFVKGVQGGTASTAAITEILSFEAADQEDGSVLVQFQVSGPEPDQWTLRCTDEAEKVTKFPVEDRTATLTGLQPNRTYTLSLDAGPGYYLGGTTSIEYSRIVPVTAQNLTAESVTNGSITVVWEADNDAATQWTAVCSGDDGYASTQVTEVCRAVFEGTGVGVTYTIAVTNPTMDMPVLLTVESTACQVTSFTAEIDGTTASLAWETEGEPAPDTWVLRYGPASCETRDALEVSGTSAELTDLIPGTDYVFTLSDAAGVPVGGTTETTAGTGEASLYEDHDFGGIFIGLYEKPGEIWSVSSLGSAKESFSPGAGLVCVIQPQAEPQTQKDPEEILTQLVVRSEDGTVAAYAAPETHSWNEMWQNGVFATALDTVPETAGSYKLELYFNGKLLRTASFTVG